MMIILWIFVAFSEVNNLIIHDIIHISPYLKFGKSYVQVYNTYLGKHGQRYCDTMAIFYAWWTRQCDFTILNRLCYIHQDIKGGDLDYYMSLNEIAFEMDVYGYLYTTYRRYLICTPTVRNDLADNTDIHSYSIDINYYQGLFSMYLHLTVIVAEREFDASLWTAVRFDIYPFTKDTFRRHIKSEQRYKFRSDYWFVVLSSTIVDIVEVYSKCVDDYFGIDCWYYCIITERTYCHCTGYNDHLAPVCMIYCKPGWLNIYASYELREFRELVPYCDIKDLCYSNITNKCNNSDLCLPVDNNTFYCVSVQFGFYSPWEELNITSEVFYKYELIKIKVFDSKIKPSYITTNSTFLSDLEELYNYQIVAMSEMADVIEIIGDFNESLYEFNLTYVFNDWMKKYIRRTKKFKIYETPSDIDIYNELDQSITDYIYLNETISCNSSVKPIYKSMTYWTFSCCIDIFPVTNRFRIAITSLTKYTKIACFVNLFAHNRSTFTRRENKIVFIKIFKFFGWNTTNNILESAGNISCDATLYIDFGLHIIQIEGDTLIPIVNHYLILLYASGGTYTFICILQTALKLVFSKTIQFELRTNPEFVCLFFYPPVAGYIIQCGHNGHIPDEYTIDTALYIWKSTHYDMYLSKELYVRLPYTADQFRYYFLCNISSNLKRVYSKAATWMETTTTLSYREYILSDNNKDCANSDQYLEKPEVFQYKNNTMVIMHNILLLSDVNSGMTISLIYIVLSLTLIVLTPTIFVFLMFESTRFDFLRYSDLRKGYRLINRRKLHFAIVNIADNFMHPTFMQLDSGLFKLKSFSKISTASWASKTK